MKSWLRNINGIFCLVAISCFLTGCKTTEEKKAAKEQTLIKVHLEAGEGSKADRGEASLYRENPMMIPVDTKELVNNIDIISATVVDVPGGFGIRLVFDDHGRRVLENITARNLGKRLVVYAAWPEVRWLAAPRITRRIGDGTLIFTPDASREESELIVRGINNIAKKVAKGRWP